MIEYGIIDLSDKINNMNDTAAIIKNLDLVISIDTSVAHLSGAIGQKVWTLLSSVSDWRWFDKSHKSPWYPTMRLFRQSKFGDWQSLLSEVKKELLKEFSP
jgi:ADP-heptose:LPS heptosyltransferase